MVKLKENTRYVCANGWITPKLVKEGTIFKSGTFYWTAQGISMGDLDNYFYVHPDNCVYIPDDTQWDIIKEYDYEQTTAELFKVGPAETKNGEKAYIYSIFYNNGTKTIHGAVKNDKGEWGLAQWPIDRVADPVRGLKPNA